MPSKDHIVLDASVVIKWFHQEEKTDKTLELLDQFTNDRLLVYVPDLILYEVANAIIRGIGKPLPEANRVIDVLEKMSWRIIIPSAELIKDAMSLAADRPKLSVYDALYVSIALHYDAIVITNDTVLHKIIGEPTVRLL